MNNINIILLDDHPVVREGLKHMLDQERGLCVLADSGRAQDALGLIRMHRPDVLVLDVEMETETFDLVEKLRGIFPELKVLFVTGFDSPNNLREAKKCGASGLVSKLEGAKRISQAVRDVAEGRLYFSTPSQRAMESKSREALSLRPKPVHHPLSPREVDVLCCVAQAMTAKEIAKDLSISVKTVDRHKANIMEKLNMRSQIELARYAIRHGFVEA